MKKFNVLLFVVLFFFGFAAESYSQSILPKFGITAGMNLANVSGKDAPNGNSTKTGLYIGGFMNYKFANSFALQPEVAFSMQGTTGNTNGANYTLTANYIDIPVLLKFYFDIQGASTIKPSLYAGPYLAFNVASSIEVQQNGQTTTTDLKNQTKSTDIGMAVGGGVGFGIGPSTLDLSLRYSFGFTTTDNSGADATIKNSVFAIIAAYSF